MEDTETKVLTKQGKKDLEEKLNELVTIEDGSLTLRVL